MSIKLTMYSADLSSELPLDFAVPCGMIIKELATTPLKYAFPEEGRGSGLPPCIIRVALAGDAVAAE